MRVSVYRVSQCLSDGLVQFNIGSNGSVNRKQASPSLKAFVCYFSIFSV